MTWVEVETAKFFWQYTGHGTSEVEAVRWVKVQPEGQALADAVAGVLDDSVTTPAKAMLRSSARLALAANRLANTIFKANP